MEHVEVMRAVEFLEQPALPRALTRGSSAPAVGAAMPASALARLQQGQRWLAPLQVPCPVLLQLRSWHASVCCCDEPACLGAPRVWLGPRRVAAD